MKKRLLSKAPLFGELPDEYLEQIAEKMQSERYVKGKTIFSRGEPGHTLYFIKSGWVQLYGEGGSRLATVGPGSLLGETELLMGQAHAVSAEANSDVELLALTRQDLVELIAANPALGIKLSQALGRRIELLNRYLAQKRLRPLPAFACLSEDELCEMASQMELIVHPGDGAIFREGECASHLFIVEDGTVQVFSSCDRDAAYVELRSGEAIGEMAVLTGKPHMVSARAAQPVTLWALPAEAFRVWAQKRPAIRKTLSENLRERLSAEDQETAVNKLRNLPLFADLPSEALADVAGALLLRHVPAGEMVYRRGDPGDALYLIESGEVSVQAGSTAAEAFATRLSEGDFFGETALLTGKPRSVSAKAETDVNLWMLYRSDFERLVNRYPAISLALSRLLSERLAAAGRSFVERHLRQLSLLSGLTSKQLEDVSDRLRPAKFRAGETILREGASGDVMYLIEAGRVEVTVGAGRPVILDTLSDGDFFGEMALLTGKPRMATVRALTDVDLWELSKADFDALLLKYPSLTIALSKVLGQRLSVANSRLVEGFVARPAAAVAPAPVSAPAPAVGPVRHERRPVAPVPAPIAARPSPGFGLQRTVVSALEGLRRSWGDFVAWFGQRSPAARLRLIAVMLLLAWLIGVAAPAALISSLGSNDVTLANAVNMAFIHPPTPIAEVAPARVAALPAAAPIVVIEPSPTFTAIPPTETPVPTDTPLPPPPTATPAPPTATLTPVPPTPTATWTPLPPPPPPAAVEKPAAPAAAPAVKPAAAAMSAQPPISWDGRLDAMRVRIGGANVSPGQPYWRIVEVKWGDEQQSQGKHHIYVDVLDETGKRVIFQPVIVEWPGGSERLVTEDKPAPEYSCNFPMYAVLGTYSVRVDGLPSETLVGLGLGTPELPAWKIHTTFYIKYQKTIR